MLKVWLFLLLAVIVSLTRSVSTDAPTEMPTVLPTVVPTIGPTEMPTVMPTTSAPTAVPTTRAPSVVPTISPTEVPTIIPTEMPTVVPTTSVPSCAPTYSPTVSIVPSVMPTVVPTTSAPSVAPTRIPTTTVPSVIPTVLPTTMPTLHPTIVPTEAPTVMPTIFPSMTPSVIPTIVPSCSPTESPTHLPSENPTFPPSVTPSVAPSIVPSQPPSLIPTTPTVAPTIEPSVTPTVEPTIIPTAEPSELPTVGPTLLPTRKPTASPTLSFAPTRSPTTQGWVTRYQFSDSSCGDSALNRLDVFKTGMCFTYENKNGSMTRPSGQSYGSYMYECKNGKVHSLSFDDAYCLEDQPFSNVTSSLNQCQTAPYDDYDEDDYWLHDQYWYDWKCYTSYEDAVDNDLSGTFQTQGFIGEDGCDETNVTGATVFKLDYCYPEIYNDTDSGIIFYSSYIYFEDRGLYYNDSLTCSTTAVDIYSFSTGCYPSWSDDQYYADDIYSDSTFYQITVTPAASTNSKKATGLSTGALIGIIVGAVVGFVLLAVVVWWFMRSGEPKRVHVTSDDTDTRFVGESQTKNPQDKYV